MTAKLYAGIIAQARTGRATFSEDAVRAAVTAVIWPNGFGVASGGDWLDRDEAFKSLCDLPFTIANIVIDNEIETAIDASYSAQAEAFVMYVHGINRYDFTTARAEEEAGKPFNPTNPEWLRGGPKLAFDFLKRAGLEPALTAEQSTDPCGLGGTRLILAVAPPSTT